MRKCIEYFQEHFKVTDSYVSTILEKLSEHIIDIFKGYKETRMLTPLLDQHDFEGNLMLNYFPYYDLFREVNCDIMDEIVLGRWNGELNKGFIKLFDYQLSWLVL